MVSKGNQSENNKRQNEPSSPNDNSQDNLTKKARETGGIPRERLKPFIISLAIVVISSATADILLKYSMSGNRAPKVHSASGIPFAVVEALANPWLDIAIVLMIIQFITFAHTLRIAPLSLVVPVRGATTYIATTLLAIAFLHEKVTLERWGSISIILIGVVIIGLTGQGKKS
jgi:multidrug transporter EmrE-like cation transporter